MSRAKPASAELATTCDKSDRGEALRLRRNPKLIAVAVNGMHEARMVWIRLNLLPKPCNGVIDRPGIGQCRITPDFAQQLVTIHHAIRSLGEVVQQVEVPPRQVKRARAVGRTQRREIDDDRHPA